MPYMPPVAEHTEVEYTVASADTDRTAVVHIADPVRTDNFVEAGHIADPECIDSFAAAERIAEVAAHKAVLRMYRRTDSRQAAVCHNFYR